MTGTSDVLPTIDEIILESDKTLDLMLDLAPSAFAFKLEIRAGLLLNSSHLRAYIPLVFWPATFA